MTISKKYGTALYQNHHVRRVFEQSAEEAKLLKLPHELMGNLRRLISQTMCGLNGAETVFRKFPTAARKKMRQLSLLLYEKKSDLQVSAK